VCSFITSGNTQQNACDCPHTLALDTVCAALPCPLLSSCTFINLPLCLYLFFFLWLIVLPLRRRQRLSPQIALHSGRDCSGPHYYFVCAKGDCSLSCKKYTLPISIVQSIGIQFLQFCMLHMLLIFSVGYTYVSARSTVEPWFTNAFHIEQIGSRTDFPNKKVSGEERCLE
jgi:hypothetical protein